MRSRVLASPLFVALVPAMALGACNLNPQPLPPEQAAARDEQDAATSSGLPGGFAADGSAPSPIALNDAGPAFGGGPEDAVRPTNADADAAGFDAGPEGGRAPWDVDAALTDRMAPGAAAPDAPSDAGASGDPRRADRDSGGPD